MRAMRQPPCFVWLLASFLALPATAQYHAVEQIDKGFFVSSDPTITNLRPSDLGDEAKATLIFIPGGDGSAGMKPTWPENAPYLTRNQVIRALRQLSNKAVTSGAFHVVIYDHPIKFIGYQGRAANDHMIRIESVARHYAQMLKKPVWLMGHSNGSYSIAEFQRYLQKHNKTNLIQGLIFSAGREESSFTADVNKPMLFMVSEQDGCGKTSPSSNRRIFERVRESNKASTEFVLIKTAQAEAKDPCLSGFHMYFGAEEEVGRVLDGFLSRHTIAR